MLLEGCDDSAYPVPLLLSRRSFVTMRLVFLLSSRSSSPLSYHGCYDTTT